ncbi:hypothetical protein NHP21005_10580 [Helicobacter sp. NHP21005]|uniref:hypothetical protein n=1 Tax=Helicobacter felistomachi TaxID=3040201 RepID=UPI002572C1E5|nr:hypothetical protein [Helicobacter sp. NHP21005]BEG57370.1 hypothetical protein NHP21005_10580 [Helicobacter sp. NHP21005]
MSKKVKLNDKTNLGDTHGSAFLPIKVSSLVKDTACFFGTIENLQKQTKEIKIYLGCCA